jgi:hypothetical protein
MEAPPPGFADALMFPLVSALTGRRARRFLLGASIPDGVFAFTSRHEPIPLTELEQLMVLTAVAGNTSWHYAHMHNARYAPHLPNYASAASGRTFPSGAGFHTSEVFFTDDNGAYFFPTRDAPALVERAGDGTIDYSDMLTSHRQRIRMLANGRLNIPYKVPEMEGHNTWVSNRPGSTLIIPVADLAQHYLAGLCYWVQNGFCIYDDINRQPIPGLDRYSHLVDLNSAYPLSFAEQLCVTECAAELSTACYAGALMLQAMGLGGWMYDGIDPFVVLGASGDPSVPGLGFRYDSDERWVLPNPTGLPGIFEGFCPPHYPNMRAAVEALAERKFEPGGPFNQNTPGPWKESAKVRGSAQVFSEEFTECVALMAQYVYDRFGKFPGTVPTMLIATYLQAHHLDLEFYDQFFEAGAYLQTHAEHMEKWHSQV